MKKLNSKFFLGFVLILVLSLQVSAQTVNERRARDLQSVKDYFNLHYYKTVNKSQGSNALDKYSLGKSSGINAFVTGEKNYLMNGNNVTVDIYNYGGIGGGYPSASIREVGGLVWNKLPYIFQFCPIVGASVPDNNDPTKRIHIISDGLFDYNNYRDESPTGERWVWKPLSGYADPDQSSIASNPSFDSDRDGKPDSWPREWYNSTLGEYVWPGYLTQGENNADLEVFWAMDDAGNKEFNYFPYLNDTTKKGLGLQVDCRAFQWSNSLAANSIFFVYTITNKGDKDLDSVFFGVYGDPDVGGKDNKDDNGFFIPPYGSGVNNIPVYARSMVYFWDPDMIGDRGLPLGYLGCKFLESPGSIDGIDNDGDGLTDETQDDGIDNDNDWKVETDDVGVDGIPNTGDEGEGNGVPTRGKKLADGSPDPLQPGEPNFEYTDLDESDQIGLTSFNSWTWSEDKISNDESMWYRSVPGNFGDIQQSADLVFVYGSGYIALKKGETKRISIAFLFGEDLGDLLVTAETVQDIYNKNYRFFKPPEVPNVTAVPDDKKVTLYWDTKSETSKDPITGEDFEGYVIYRSTDPSFSDIQKITDGKGSSFLYEPLKDGKGFDAKWDLSNSWKGYHPIPYQGRGIHYYLGDNSGLVHSFVDSNNVINGQTYYYAVVAYDHGDSLGIPPSETTKKISVDPITGQLRFDPNTVQVIPGPRASGYIKPGIGNQNITHTGLGNGIVDFKIIDELKVKDNEYKLTFSDTLKLEDTSIKAKNFSVLSNSIETEQLYLFDYKFASLKNSNLLANQNLVVKDAQGKAYTKDVDYVINTEKGSIRRKENGTMPNNAPFTISYNYYPVYQSTLVNDEDAVPVFDGVKLKVKNYSVLQADTIESGWIEGNSKITWKMIQTTLGMYKLSYPGDYKVTFFNDKIDSTYILVTGGKLVSIPANFKVEEVSTGLPIKVLTFMNEVAKKDSQLSRGDEIIFFKPGSKMLGGGKDTLTWALTLERSLSDSSIPGTGNTLYLSIQRPFTTKDEFVLKTKSGYVDNNAAKGKLDNIYVVPNPYVAVNDLEPANRLSSQNRGERRIYFENLPTRCTIRIYTLAGELVQQLEHDENVDNGREYWNLLNKDGFGVSYGIYLAHIDAPGVGEKLIKFALIK